MVEPAVSARQWLVLIVLLLAAGLMACLALVVLRTAYNLLVEPGGTLVEARPQRFWGRPRVGPARALTQESMRRIAMPASLMCRKSRSRVSNATS
jgi:hypothetical protein